MPKSSPYFALAACLLLWGCSQQDTVYVMGPGGEPVADARVVVLYRGLSTSVAAVTDANGKTQVKPLQGPIGLMAIKPGYGQGQAPFPSSWPATIQLKPFSPPLGGMRLPAAQPPGLAASQPAQPARK